MSIMKIGIPKEVHAGETRVALVPNLVSLLTRDQHEVLVETGAGEKARLPDALYRQAGATLVENAPALYAQADIIFKVLPPEIHPITQQPEVDTVGELPTKQQEPRNATFGFGRRGTPTAIAPNEGYSLLSLREDAGDAFSGGQDTVPAASRYCASSERRYLLSQPAPDRAA